MAPPVTRRAALRGSAAAALGLAAGAAPALASAAPVAGSPVIAAAEAVKALRVRELQAWDDLGEDWPDDSPACLAAGRLSSDLAEAGEALADMPATTADEVAAKASALVALVSLDKIGADGSYLEHCKLIGAVLRDAARLGGGAYA